MNRTFYSFNGSSLEITTKFYSMVFFNIFILPVITSFFWSETFLPQKELTLLPPSNPIHSTDFSPYICKQISHNLLIFHPICKQISHILQIFPTICKQISHILPIFTLYVNRSRISYRFFTPYL